MRAFQCGACGQFQLVLAVTVQRAHRTLYWYFVVRSEEDTTLKISFEGDYASFESYYARQNGTRGGMLCYAFRTISGTHKPCKSSDALIGEQVGDASSGGSEGTTHAGVRILASGFRITDGCSTGGARASLVTLPPEIRDMIFGHYSTLHAVPIQAWFDHAYPAWAGNLLVLRSPAFLIVDGTTASQARKVCRLLRDDFQRALDSVLRRQPVRQLFVVSWKSSSARRRLLSQISCDHKAEIIMLADCR